VLYTGMQWKCLPVPKAPDGTDAIHYTTVYRAFARWSDDGSLKQAFIASVAQLSVHNLLDLSILHGDGTHTVAKKGGDGIGYSGYKHQKGDKVIAIVENNGYILAPLPVAPVNEADTVLLPDGLKALKRIGKQTGLSFKDTYLNLDGGFDSASKSVSKKSLMARNCPIFLNCFLRKIKAFISGQPSRKVACGTFFDTL
jgi:hypothetical protein